MLKKTAALGSVLALLSTAPTLAHSYFKSGFLAGAHVGTSSGSGSFNSSFDKGIGLIPTASGKVRKTSALFGILAGYRHFLQDGFSVGLDITGNIFSKNELNKQLDHIALGLTFPFKNKLSRRYSVIPTVNFGKTFCDRWYASVGFGMGISSFKQEVTNLTRFADGSIRSPSTTFTKLGFVPSVGVEYAATQNVSIAGNISYEIYKKISKKYNSQQLTGANGSSYTSSISPRYLTLRIGAVYRF